MSIHILTINSNGQITLPAIYRKNWKLKPHTKIRVKFSKNKTMSILNNNIGNYTLDDLPLIVGKFEPVSPEDLQQEIEKTFQTNDGK